MNFNKKQASTSIRFRRWSRAGYAVFCSLACTVTIGSLAVSISDKLLQKAVGVAETTTLATSSDTKSPELSSEFMDLEAILQINQETSLLKITTDCAVACYQVINIYFINQNG